MSLVIWMESSEVIYQRFPRNIKIPRSEEKKKTWQVATSTRALSALMKYMMQLKKKARTASSIA